MGGSDRTNAQARMDVTPSARRRALPRLMAGLTLAGSLVTGSALLVHPLPAAAASLNLTETWSKTLDAGQAVVFSAPMVANLSGGAAVVVGDLAGNEYALSLSNGATVPGWPFSTSGVPINSTASVAPEPGGTLDDVYIGVGSAGNPQRGAYQAINPNGSPKWFQTVQNPASDNQPVSAVVGSLAVGSLQGATDVVGMSLGQEEYALDAQSGATLAGFPWFQADSSFSTPALADLYGDGRTEIVEGGDSTAGNAYGVQYQSGGHIRILSATGNAGTGVPSGGLICQYDTNQNVMSSPAVGNFLANGAVGIVSGTGDNFANASDTDTVIAINPSCGLAWQDKLDGLTLGSPAIANVAGNGKLQVVEGTDNGSGGGSVWVLDGATGQTVWKAATSGEVIGSVVTADLTGGGYNDVIVPTTNATQIFDGKTGALVGTIGAYLGNQNAPLVTDDPNGTIGITIAGYDGNSNSIVDHYEISGSNGANVNEANSWPMFHHDPQLTGNASGAPYTPLGSFTEFASDHANNRVWNAYNRSATAGGPTVYGTANAFSDPADGLEHVYTEATNGDLVEWIDDGVNGRAWNAYDHSIDAGGGGPIVGTPFVVYDEGMIHVFAESASGHLMEYIPDHSGGHVWNAYDHTLDAGGGTTISSSPQAIVDTNGLVHVYVASSNGHLMEFLPDHVGGHVWNAYDHTLDAGGGTTVVGAPDSIVDTNGLVHVYVEAASGHLVEYLPDHVGGFVWNAYDHTLDAGGGAPIGASPDAVVDGNGLVHVYVQDWQGHLVEYLPDHVGGFVWNAYDHTLDAGGGAPINGAPSAVWDRGGGMMHVFVRSAGGHLVEYLPDHVGGNGRVWNAYDHTDDSGGPAIGSAPNTIDVSGTIYAFTTSG